MQFEIDIQTDHKNLFLHLRSLILAFACITEKRNAKQTSYYDNYSAVCFLRVRRNRVRLTFANGAKMSEQFIALLGTAKIVRYLEFTAIEDVNEEEIIKMIEESLLLNIEKAAMRTLRQQQRHSVGDER